MQFLRIAILCSLLSGCTSAPPQLEAPGRYVIGSAYSIKTSRNWTRYRGLGAETRTIDGPALGRLSTWAAVHDGESLAEVDDRQLPRFRSDFTAVEVSELVADTIEALSTGADVSIEGLQPAPFGSLPGFRFSYEYVDNGLPTKGAALGSVSNGTLHLILFAAPADHYFDLYSPEVNRVFASVAAPP